MMGISLSLSQLGFVVARYQQLRQDAEILAGSALALVLLAVGASLHAWRIEGWRRFLLSVAVCATVVVVVSISLAIRRHLAAARLAKGQKRRDGGLIGMSQSRCSRLTLRPRRVILSLAAPSPRTSPTKRCSGLASTLRAAAPR